MQSTALRKCGAAALSRGAARAAAPFSSAADDGRDWAKAAGQSDADGSRFENYHEAAQVYDQIRYAGGVEVTLGAWAAGGSSGGTPLHRQRVLDVGCGTGNYAAAVAPHVGTVDCFDGNASMLAKCEEKLGGSANAGTFTQGLLPDLPFASGTYDAAMCNLVVHHIEDDDTRPTWARTTAAVHEVARVLKPGGTFCLNHLAPEQVDCYWFLHYVPVCRERFRATLVPQQRLAGMFEEAGLQDVRRATPLDYALFRPLPTYLQPDGPLDPEWRKSTSMWALGDAAELEEGMAQLRADIASGDIQQVLEEYEARRRELGHTMFFYGSTPN
jgi:ubiquinone/menaquinone biosynthesis C-methylase UbiE